MYFQLNTADQVNNTSTLHQIPVICLATVLITNNMTTAGHHEPDFIINLRLLTFLIHTLTTTVTCEIQFLTLSYTVAGLTDAI